MLDHPAGRGDFFLARVVEETIAGPYPSMQKLPSLRVIPPPPVKHMAYAFGRLWIASGKKLYYSDPQTYDWFRDTGYLPFPEELVSVAPVTTGLFVSSRTSTWYLDGNMPGKMSLSRRGPGAIPGTLTYAQIEGAAMKSAARCPSCHPRCGWAPRGWWWARITAIWFT